MAADKLAGVPSQKLVRRAGDVAVVDAVESVLAQLELVAQLVGQRVAVRNLGNGCVKRRVERHHIGHVGQDFPAGDDDRCGGVVVQGRKRGDFLDLLEHVVIDQARVVEIRAAVHDAMAKGVDVMPLHEGGVLQHGTQHERDCGAVVGNRQGQARLATRELTRERGLAQADTLAGALGEHFARFDVEELIFQRRAAGVHDQDVHGPSTKRKCPARTRTRHGNTASYWTNCTRAAGSTPSKGCTIDARRRNGGSGRYSVTKS